MSELILIGYPAEDTARDVWRELVTLRREFLIDLDDAAVIRRDARGKVHVTAPAHHGVSKGGLSGFFWGTVIGVLLLPFAPLFSVAGGLMGAAMGAAGDLDIREDFKKEAQDLLQPGTSAIFVAVRRANPEKVLEAIGPYGGTVLRSSLSDDAQERLMTALHGEIGETGRDQQ
jgi:uncharacterized membrane protein